MYVKLSGIRPKPLPDDPTLQQTQIAFLKEAEMAEQKATGKLEKHDSASELRKENPEKDSAEGTADARLLQNSSDAQQALDQDVEDTDIADSDIDDAAEDADDELDTDDNDDFEEIQPLNINKTGTNKDSDQVHLSTKNPQQTTQTTAHTHSHVKWADNFAQAGKTSAKLDHTAHIALKHNLPRAPTPHPQPLAANQFADLLHPSPPLRHRKGSQTLRKIISDIPTDHSIMSKTRRDENALYGHTQDHAAENSDNSNAYMTPTRRGKMPETRGSQDEFSRKEKGITADFRKSNETSTSSEDQILKPEPRSLQKAHAVLGYYDEDKITPKKSMTDLVKSPKSVRGKKSFRKLFHRKEGKESTTPPSSSSSSGGTKGHKIISAPTLIDASPNAKALLSSAPSLIDGSPGAKNVVNYSRPIVRHSSSDVSNDRSNTALYGSNPVLDPSTSPEGLTFKSGNTQVGLNAALVSQKPGLRLPNADEEQTQNYSNASAAHGKQTAIAHAAVPKTSATEKNADGSDSDSFNPSDYSGDENSVQQAVAVPIIFSGRAKLVDVRPPRGINTAASGNRSNVATNALSGKAKLTDREAEALGAQDAERYYRNTMNAQARSANIAEDDPFIDPAYRNLLAKPANEIAAKEMARIKAVREARNQGGGLMERMNALRAKNVAKPEVEHAGVATAGPRTNTGESLLSKMRGHKKRSKKENEQDSEEEVVRKVQADIEHGLHEENEIHALIKAKMAAKAAASGGVPGAGIPRIDYGAPSLHTALGGCGPTDEERAHARVLAAHDTAGSTGGRVPKNEDNATARGHFEGY